MPSTHGPAASTTENDCYQDTGAGKAFALPTVYTVAQLAEIEPALGIGSIRSDLFNRRTNGLEESGAVIYRGRKILLHRNKYLCWMVARSRRAA